MPATVQIDGTVWERLRAARK